MTVASAREQPPQVATAPTESFCVLVIDDHAADATAVRAALRRASVASFAVLRAPSLDAGIDALHLGDIDIVLVHDDLLDDEAITDLLEAAGPRPVVALTHSADPLLATRLIDAGLHDAVASGASASEALGGVALRSIHRARATRHPIDPMQIGSAADDPGQHAAIGSSAAMRRQIAEARTPLAALIDLLDLLSSAWDALAEGNKLSMLSSIRSYAARVEQLTAELASLAAAPAAPPSSAPSPSLPAPQPVGLAQAVARAIALTGVGTSTDIDPNIVVWVDPRHLEQMLTSLLTQVTHRSTPPVRAVATSGGTSVRLSIHGARASVGGGAVAGRGGGWSLLQPNPVSNEIDGLDLALEAVRRLAESNGGLAGTDDQPGSAWLRLPSAPPDPALV